jgi:hypothetical protein
MFSENVSKTPVPFARVRGYQAERVAGRSFEIGDPWRFYSLFWKAHDLGRLAELLPVPEASAQFGERLPVQMRACNYTAESSEVVITALLPAGWTDHTQSSRYP